jgi:hypothetical protein
MPPQVNSYIIPSTGGPFKASWHLNVLVAVEGVCGISLDNV